ncbi:MAG: hypothetical protein Q8S00_32685 [Deltaproteobacteria bacterium]|nr:hypothetical protein [Deltaproteobacteria bacterium]
MGYYQSTGSWLDDLVSNAPAAAAANAAKEAATPSPWEALKSLFGGSSTSEPTPDMMVTTTSTTPFSNEVLRAQAAAAKAAAAKSAAVNRTAAASVAAVTPPKSTGTPIYIYIGAAVILVGGLYLLKKGKSHSSSAAG